MECFRFASTATRAQGAALVTADVRADAAGGALSALETLGVPVDDIALLRLDAIAPGGDASETRPSSGRTCSVRHARRRGRLPATSRLVRRGLGTLVVGLATTGVLALAVTALLNGLDALPAGFTLTDFSAAQTHVNATTILVALAAASPGCSRSRRVRARL